jgi:hypothetical protein
MPEYFSYDDDLHYTPDAIVQDQENSVSTPQEDDRTKKMGSPRNVPLECYRCGATGSYEKFGIPTKCPHCGSYEVHLDQEKDNAESEMVHKGIEDPFGFDDEEWERKLRESMKKQASAENAIIEESKGQLRSGQDGIQDEDSPEGNLGSPIMGKKTVTWFPFYASDPGDEDNPGTDVDHQDIGDTDNAEEDSDADYGGKNRRNPKSESTTATLVAMGGIGAIPKFANEIPEGKHGNHDIVYGDDEEEEI